MSDVPVNKRQKREMTQPKNNYGLYIIPVIKI
jgi:hypothetical protein